MADEIQKRGLYGSLDAYDQDETELESLRRQQQARTAPDWMSEFQVSEEKTAPAEKPSWLEQFVIDPLQGTGIPSAIEAEPRQELTIPERQRRLDYLAQETELALGEPIIQGGIENAIQRFRLQAGGRRSKEDVTRSIKEYIPGAETQVVTLPNSVEVVAFKRPGSPGYELINPGGPDFGDLGAALSYFANFEMGLTLSAAILTRGFGFLPRLATQAATAGSGRAADISVDRLLGDRPRPIEDTLGDVALSAVFGAAGEGLGTGLSKGINIARGSGVLETSAASREATAIAREMGLPGLTMGQRHPLTQRAEALFDATTDPLQAQYAAQREAGRLEVQAYKNNILGQDGALAGLSDEELDSLILTRTQQIRDTIDNPKIALRKGARELNKAKNDFEILSAQRRDTHYYRALKLAGDDVIFNMQPAFSKIDEILTGTQVPTRAGGVSRAERRVSPELRDLMQRISTRPDELSGTTGYEALKTWRTELGDIMRGDYQAADSSKRNTMKLAAELHASVTDIIENAKARGRVTLERPTKTGGAQPEYQEIGVLQESDFTRAWKRANVFNRWRERVLDMDVMSKIANETNPVALMNQFARPGEFQSLRTLKRLMPKESWKAFTDAYKTRLINNPSKILQTFDEFADEPEALNLLIPKDMQMDFRILGRAFNRLNRSQNEWVAQTDAGDRAMSMIDSGNKGELVVAIDAAGGSDSVVGKRIRAGIFQKILDRSETVSKFTNRPVIDPSKAVAEIDKYLSNNSFQNILTESDITTLNKMRTYLQGVGTLGNDAGTSLAGTELASGFFDFLNPKEMAKAASRQFKNALAARIFLSPKASNLVFGKGFQYQPITSVRALSQALAVISRDTSQEELEVMGRRIQNTAQQERDESSP